MFITRLRTWTGRQFFLGDLKRAYQLTFNRSRACQLVLADLGDFTRAYHPNGTFDADPYQHARLEGRREVWQRIMNHIHLEDAKLMALYMNHQIHTEDE